MTDKKIQNSTDQQLDSISYRKPTEEEAFWDMRWFFLKTLTTWTAGSVLIPLILFWLTKNPLSLSLLTTIAPPVYLWHKLAKFLFTNAELERAKIHAKSQKFK